MRIVAAVIAAVLLSAWTTNVHAADEGKFNLWVYWHKNIGDDKQADQTVAFMERIAKAGYTGIAVLNNKFHRWNQVTPQEIANYKRVREKARELKLDFIATVLPLGYANDLLSNDVNLAEGVPVVDAPFAVKGGKLVPDDPTTLVNGDFAKFKDNQPEGWTTDLPGKVTFIDPDVKYNGKPSLRFQDPAKGNEYSHARAQQEVSVRPWRYYHISCAFKTDGLTQPGDVRLMALAVDGPDAGRWLNVPYLYAEKTKDWKFAEYTFNTRDCTKVAIYVGSWGGGLGKFWFADVKMEAGGLVNMLRRDGCPFKATTADGAALVEGKDLPEMRDPGTGHSPYLGGYNWHAQPEIVIPAGSRLKEGDRVLLSYSHAMLMCYNDQVPICMADPKTNELIDWCVGKIHETLKPDGWFLEHDEIRMQGWDDSCRKTGKTCGEILAANIKFCSDTIWKRQPGAPIYVWSDMFDPFHNAKKDEYYDLVRGKGAWNGSWKGLDKKVGLINWSGKPESAKFFSDEGHPQLISTSGAGALAALYAKEKDLKGLNGAIYVTWSGDFSGIEAFAKKAHELWGK